MIAGLAGWTLALILKSTALLLAAAVIGTALRRRSAAVRHAVWSVALLGLVVLPLLSVTLPRWELAVLPARPAPEAAPRPARAAQVELAPATALPSPSMTEAAAAPTSDAPKVHWGTWVGLAWSLGATFGLLRVAAGACVARRLVRGAVPPADPEWRTILADVSHALDLTRRVELLESPEITLPVVWGYRRARVLLPPDAADWPRARKRAFLLHELAHVERHDCLVQTLASLVHALYWPHPLVWWTMRRLRRDAEQACDDRVLSVGTRGRDYAGHLLDVARAVHQARTPAVVMGIAERSNLEDRLLALLDPHLRRGGVRRPAVAGSAVVGLALVATVAAIQPVARAAVAQVLALAAPPAVVAPPPAETLGTVAVARPLATRLKATAAPVIERAVLETPAAVVLPTLVEEPVAEAPLAPALPITITIESESEREAAREAPPVVRIGVDVVQIDAIVTDRRGRQIDDLTAGDFEIQEDGKPRSVAHARYVPAATRATPSEVPRQLTFVVDDLGLSFESLHRVREGLNAFVEEQLGPSDAAAIVHTSGEAPVAQASTADKRRLRTAIDGLRHQGWSRATGRPGDFRDSYFLRRHGETTFAVLESTLDALRTATGRKSVVFFSERLSLRDPDSPTATDLGLVQALQRVTDAAGRANAVVYSVDPRVLAAFNWGPARTGGLRDRLDDHEGLAHLAEATGGLPFLQGWDVGAALERVLEDQKGYYLIAYDPDDAAFQPNERGQREYHRVRVRVKRPGVTVRSRGGFYGVTDEEWPPLRKS